jgi:hypothetical protein
MDFIKGSTTEDTRRMNSPAPNGPRRRFRFKLRDLFLLILCVAAFCGWWVDRQRILRRTELDRMRLEQLLRVQRTVDVASTASGPPTTVLTPAELVRLVAVGDDWYELQDALTSFRDSAAKDEAVDDLLKLLSHTDEKVRTRSLSALGQIRTRGSAVLPAVMLLLDDPVANVQWHAACALKNYGSGSELAIPSLKEKMMDNNCEIAAFAAIVTKQLDPTIDIGPRLAELVHNPIRENRWRAVTHLSEHVSAETAKRHLTTLFETEDDNEIREMIAGELNQIESKRPHD